jgi:predicted TIM-barrel fold metal-dependent hydrolase
VVVSADTHAGAPPAVMREYLDGHHRPAFDEECRGRTAMLDAALRMFSTNADPAAEELDAPRAEQFERWRDRTEGYWRPERWLRDQEADGVVASVIYPEGRPTEGPAFQRSEDLEQQRAGIRAWNRWLADFCGELGPRAAGLAMLPPLHELDAVLVEVEAAAAGGLRGVILPDMLPDQLAFHHPMYDPIWAACEEAGLPLNVHGTTAGPAMFTPAQLGDRTGTEGVVNPGVFGDGTLVGALGDGGTGARRLMHVFVYGGVFDRFPGLRIAFTEAFIEWVPYERIRLSMPYTDLWYAAASKRELRRTLARHPDEYWQDHFFFGASFMAPRETLLRHDIGVGNIMWGSDYPHPEGTFGVTRESLRNTFAEAPPADVRLMLGENAARLYGLDLTALQRIADRVGPAVAAVHTPIDALPTSLTYAFR